MNRSAVETIKQKLSIETVVGSYIKLEKSGKNFRACCPFHNEKTPSFQVTPDRQIFYCFGCHKGGDIFNFVQEIEGISFNEAKKILAEKAGVPLGDYKNEAPSRAGLLREIIDNATKFYEVGLRTNASVVEYLLSRGMTKDTMITWRIGYAQKGWSSLYDVLKKKNSDENIIATGLCITGKSGLYDRFRERIMFPIADSQGRIIAFTGRIMPGTEESLRPVGKYINSPETELFHKSNILFAFDKAKQYIHTEGFAILVEGQMDCIMSHQVGVANTVALSGTACTDEHMIQIKRFTDEIAICLDADSAGLVAALKSAIVAYRHDMKVSVIDIPGSKDPADMIAENPDAWKNITRKRVDFITFRLEKMKTIGGDKVKIAKNELFPILREFKSQMRIDDKLQEIAHAFGQSSSEPVRQDFEEFLKTNITVSKPVDQVVQKIPDQGGDMKENIIGMLIKIKDSESFEKYSSQYEKIFGTNFIKDIADIPLDMQSQYAFRVEHLSKNDDIGGYERMLHDLFIRSEIAKLEIKKKLISEELSRDASNVPLLNELHALLKSRDALIHQLHH